MDSPQSPLDENVNMYDAPKRKKKSKNRKTSTLSKPSSRKHVKGAWSEEEDQKLRDLVAEYGAKRWSLIASHLPVRLYSLA
jgi:myb proto-oncogene protein